MNKIRTTGNSELVMKGGRREKLKGKLGWTNSSNVVIVNCQCHGTSKTGESVGVINDRHDIVTGYCRLNL